jgi:putative flavoprotein involved in K+ transport
MRSQRHEVIVIGAGQAGLAMGHLLQRERRDFTILEAAAEPAPAWRGLAEAVHAGALQRPSRPALPGRPRSLPEPR